MKGIMPPRIDITGMVFGRLLVMHPSGSYRGGVIWTCWCECGKLHEVTCGNLVHRTTKSCGCFYEENKHILRKFKKHGMHKSKVYAVWEAMIRRSTCKPGSLEWKNYGSRGITVCDRWRKFENFYEDMGDRPEGKSIDRIDNNGNYEPSNCRWVSTQENCQNTSATKLNRESVLAIRASNKSRRELAKEFDVNYETIRGVLLRLTWNNI